MGKIADVPDIADLDLGTFPQWTGFSFYLVNRENGTVKYPKEGETSCNAQFPRFVDQTFTFIDFGNHLNVHVKPDSAQAALPSRRIMNCLNADPFGSGGDVSYEKDRWVFYRIKGVRSPAEIDLHLESPYETLLLEDIGQHVGEYARIGHIPAGDSIRFYITSDNPGVEGEKLYGESYGIQNDYYTHRIKFEDWTDLTFNDLWVDVGTGPMPDEPNELVFDRLPYTIMYGDTAYVYFEGNRRDGYHTSFPEDQRFDVWIDQEQQHWGTLVSRDGDQRGNYLTDVRQPVLFISKTADELGIDPGFASPDLHAETTLQDPYPPLTISGRGEVRFRPERLKVGYENNSVAPGDSTVVIPYFQYRDGERQYFDDDHQFWLVRIIKGREYGHLESVDGDDLGPSENYVAPGFKFVANDNIDRDSAEVWLEVATDMVYDRPLDPEATATVSSIQGSTVNSSVGDSADAKLLPSHRQELIEMLRAEGRDKLAAELGGANTPSGPPGTTKGKAVTTAISPTSHNTAFEIGYGRVLITGNPMKLTLEIPEPKQLWPTIPAGGAQANFDRSQVENTIEEVLVTVTQDGEPVEAQPVIVSAEWVPGSGGHNHNGGDDLKAPPREQMGWIVNLEEADSARGELPAAANADGQLRLRYRAPQFGGKVKLVAKTVNSSGDTLRAEDRLTVRVPGLVPLSNFDYHEKIGGTPSHHGPRLDKLYQNHRNPDNNHWVSETVGALLDSFSVIYMDNFPNAPEIRYNDISLQNGGLFDVLGNWNSPHELHRLGQNVDVRSSPPRDDGIPLSLERRLSEILLDLEPSTTIEVHGSQWKDDKGKKRDSRHFHIDFEIF